MSDVIKMVPKPREEAAEERADGGKVVSFQMDYWEHTCGGARYTLRRGGLVQCVWCGEAVAGLVWGQR
jgi:hypothetical protein